MQKTVIVLLHKIMLMTPMTSSGEYYFQQVNTIIYYMISDFWLADVPSNVVWLFDNIQLMTFDEVKDWSTNGAWYSPRHSKWISCSMGWSILVFTEIESHYLFYYKTWNQIWINTKQRRLCSPDTPVCPTSAIINLIVYRK